MKVKLTKKQVISQSFVRAGQCAEGSLILLELRTEENPNPESGKAKSFEQVAEGQMLMVGFGEIPNFVKTSPIKKILERDDNRLVIETETSLYEVEKL